MSNNVKGVASEPKWIRPILITITITFLVVFIILPIYTIFSEALRRGIETYIESIGFASYSDAIEKKDFIESIKLTFSALSSGFSYYFSAIAENDAFAAIKLTLLVAAICVPLNTFFGILLAWAISKYDFKGKQILTTMIEAPFAISPVIAGLIFVLLFGAFGWFGAWLSELNIKIVFAVPGLVLASTFVTFPFVAKELIPLMQELGKDDEEAALTLGAGGLQIFFRVTLPNIKWGVLYGVILTNARAMGEFGAVAVVSGLIRGVTMTMPLHIEILYNEYLYSAAFSIASLLTLLSLVTLIVKYIIEHFILIQRRNAKREENL
ncbi:MAG: sulfate ABC transporter permease subunit CysW [Helicobacteraceae bacterium]|jgi:sulfate transport system permease protein|nr:sulfate ABC transporter permease subunit CysW [Helicobacteraceae bacterium]